MPSFTQEVSGGEIKAFRYRVGWSQAQLAERFGVSRRTVEDWEAKHRAPPYLRRAFLMEEMIANWQKRRDELEVQRKRIADGMNHSTNGIDDTQEVLQTIQNNIDEMDHLIKIYWDHIVEPEVDA